MTVVPFARPDITRSEIDAVTTCMTSGWLTTGQRVNHFEYLFGMEVGAKYSIAVTSATDGLYMALVAAGITHGEVIVPVWTFTATAEAVERAGCTPVFVDIDPLTLNLDLDTLESAITPYTRAIIPVHMAGFACNLTALYKIADAHGIKVIEDAAHALHSKHLGKPIGSYRQSTATVFSFYATKPITTGEGGMVCTNDEVLAKRIRRMRLHGIERTSDTDYNVVDAGIKANMSDLDASLGIAQLRRSREMHHKRTLIASFYWECFDELGIELPPFGGDWNSHSWHLFIIKIPPEIINRDDFISKMKSVGIQCSIHYKPLHLHPYWQQKYDLRPEDFPQATRTYSRVVSLPIYSGMSVSQVNYVVEHVCNILA